MADIYNDIGYNGNSLWCVAYMGKPSACPRFEDMVQSFWRTLLHDVISGRIASSANSPLSVLFTNINAVFAKYTEWAIEYAHSTTVCRPLITFILTLFTASANKDYKATRTIKTQRLTLTKSAWDLEK